MSIELLNGRLSVNSTELRDRSRAADRDVVVLSGTLLEGFGNLYSDLDLYVIGEQLPEKGPDESELLIVREDGRVRRLNETLAGPGSVLLDVQYYTFRELDTLARSLSTLYCESRRSTRIFRKTLHHDDEDLIHKLLTGRVLQDGTGVFDARRTFDPETFCFLKYRNQVGGYPEFRDLVGSWTAGDLDTCLYNIRDYLISQVSGMMFLTGSTNPRPKWFLRKLESLPAEHSDLRRGVMSWLCSARSTEFEMRKSVETACDLIDMTFEHARGLLGKSPSYYTAEEALQLTEREFAERAAHDSDSMAELQLRRRMFSNCGPPMSVQIQGHFPESNRMDAPYLAESIVNSATGDSQ